MKISCKNGRKWHPKVSSHLCSVGNAVNTRPYTPWEQRLRCCWIPLEFSLLLQKSSRISMSGENSCHHLAITHRIHGSAIYGNMDPINIPPMLAYIPAPWIRHGLYYIVILSNSALNLPTGKGHPTEKMMDTPNSTGVEHITPIITISP